MNYYEKAAEIYKVVAHPNRLRVLQYIAEHKGCNITQLNKGLDIPQPTTCQHLQKLYQAGLVKKRREGTIVRLYLEYQTIDDAVKDLSGWIV